jgi:hypothetical protein
LAHSLARNGDGSYPASLSGKVVSRLQLWLECPVLDASGHAMKITRDAALQTDAPFRVVSCVSCQGSPFLGSRAWIFPESGIVFEIQCRPSRRILSLEYLVSSRRSNLRCERLKGPSALQELFGVLGLLRMLRLGSSSSRLLVTLTERL